MYQRGNMFKYCCILWVLCCYWFDSQSNVSSLFLSEFWKVFFLFNLSELDEGGENWGGRQATVES